MPRTRWFVIGFLLMALAVSGVVNARGPFASHPSLAYDQLLVDFEAGSVGDTVRWRDQLEVDESGSLWFVIVPPDRDLMTDLDRARWAGGVSVSVATLPDIWIGQTLLIPGLLVLAAALIWITAIVRSRRATSGGEAVGSPQPAT